MKNKNLFVYLISAALCSLPLPFFVNTLFFILLIIYTVFYVIKNKIKPHFGKETLVFSLFYLLMALSYLWSINKPFSLLGIERKMAFLLMPLLFSFIPKLTSEESKRIFSYFSFAMAIYALFFISVGLSKYLDTGNLKNLSHHELVSQFRLNRIYISLFTVVAFLNLVFNTKKSFIRVLLLFILSLFLILLSSKTIVITTLSVLLFVNRQYFFKLKFKYIILSFIIIMSVLVVSGKVNSQFFSELIPRFKEVTTKQDFQKNYYFNGAEHRILYTRFLLEYIKDENIFLKGFGINTAQQKINEKCEKYRVPEGYGTSYNFHNQYNQTLAEIGIFGLLLLLYILYLGFKNAIDNKNTFALSVFIIFTMLLSTETVFNRQRGIYFFLLVFLLFINTKDENNGNTKKR